VEGRGHRYTGTFEGKMAETPRSTTVSTKLGRIAKLRKRVRDGIFVPPPLRSKAVSRRAGCGKSACPDPWEPRGAIPEATRPHHFSVSCSVIALR
jgi:hypothetical protein